MPQIAPENAAQKGSASHDLSELDISILSFEKDWWTSHSSKDEEIKNRFNLPSARYYLLLSALIDRPEALEHDPLLVKRLRRLRNQRHQARSTHRLTV